MTKPLTSSQNGFALMTLLAFLPILITLILAFAYLAKQITQQSKALHICRQDLLETQSTIGRLVENLLALNPKARRLRHSRNSAEAALVLALASSPPLVPMAKAAVAAIKARQGQLRLHQLEILYQIRSTWSQGAFSLKRKLRQAGAQRVSLNRPQAALIPIPPNSLSPSYQPLPGLTQLQKQKATWVISSHFLPSRFSVKKFKWPSKCAASIYKEKKRWQPRLVVAK